MIRVTHVGRNRQTFQVVKRPKLQDVVNVRANGDDGAAAGWAVNRLLMSVLTRLNGRASAEKSLCDVGYRRVLFRGSQAI